MTKMAFTFISVFLLLSDYTESTNRSKDLVVQYNDKNISTADLLMNLNMTLAPFDVPNITCPNVSYSCQSVCPLDNEDLERVSIKTCYCDRLCVHFGDCCFDYFTRCVTVKTPKHSLSKQTCVKPENSGEHGYAMIGSCPSDNTDKYLESLCTNKSSSADLFRMLPVSDLHSKTAYKNVFCARCNHAKNQTYWKFLASCKDVKDIPINRSLMLGFIMEKCEWSFYPPGDHKSYLKRCLAIKQDCPDSKLIKTEPLLSDLCSFYAFPVCYNVTKKNPHCEICKGNDISAYSCRCLPPSPGQSGGIVLSLDILFDFSSSSSHTVTVREKKTVVKNKLCANGFVFDPFAEKCVRIHFDVPSNKSQISRSGINKECAKGFKWDPLTEKCKQIHAISEKNLEKRTGTNCLFIEMNVSSVILLSNGSIWIPLDKRIYNNESYFINGSSLFVCVDLKGVYTESETFVYWNITPRHHIITQIPKNGSGNEIFFSCFFIKMNISSVTILSNGSIWVPLHKRMYSNESYVINGSSIFVCVDFIRAYSETETFVSRKITPRQIITYTGCTISMISLILLLGIYIALAELRTLPGKNLMSLSCAMLLYHIFVFMTDQTNRPHLCMAVSVLLHYFLLSSFCWMGVMAFDVAKTFGRKGQAARSRSDDSTKTLIKYSIFAWTTPIVIVITSVTLDKTHTVNIGYAEVLCWISNGKALLIVLGVPVALILTFNFVALSFTMVSIWKVQKTTRRVADQSNQTSLPILYIKLSSALGFTWILGFIFPFAQVEFLTYLFVILNSLQGFFIFLAFVANKRTINKVKAVWNARFSHLTDKTTSKSKQTQSSKLLTSVL